MLAVIKQLSQPNSKVEFTAIAPPAGRLAEALNSRAITHIPFSTKSDTGQKLSPAELLPSLQTAIQKSGVNIVHANSLSMGRLLGSIVNQFPVSTTCHLRDIMKLSRKAISDINQNTAIVAVSEATRAFHIGQGLDPQKCTAIHNGIDCTQFAPQSSTGELKRQLNLADDAFLIMTVGQIGLRKAQDVFVNAAIQSAGKMPNAHFLIVGERNSQKTESIEFEQALHTRIEAAGLAEQFHFLGFQTNMPKLYNEVDLLVHSAKQEPLGRVLLEAAACGLPVIATDVGGTREIFPDETTAKLVPPGDVGSLATAITEFYHSAALRSELRRNARERITAAFPIQTAAAKLEKFWKRIHSPF